MFHCFLIVFSPFVVHVLLTFWPFFDNFWTFGAWPPKCDPAFESQVHRAACTEGGRVVSACGRELHSPVWFRRGGTYSSMIFPAYWPVGVRGILGCLFKFRIYIYVYTYYIYIYDWLAMERTNLLLFRYCSRIVPVCGYFNNWLPWVLNVIHITVPVLFRYAGKTACSAG